jgi:hypothetical protein
MGSWHLLVGQGLPVGHKVSSLATLWIRMKLCREYIVLQSRLQDAKKQKNWSVVSPILGVFFLQLLSRIEILALECK